MLTYKHVTETNMKMFQINYHKKFCKWTYFWYSEQIKQISRNIFMTVTPYISKYGEQTMS